MSLRSRLVLGMLVVAVVLVATAVTITRSSRNYLVGQVDQQLHLVTAGGRNLGCNPNSPGGDPFGDRRGNFSSLFIGYGLDGVLHPCRVPNLSSQQAALPKLSAKDLTLADPTATRLITVGSVGSSMHYRVLLESAKYQVATPAEQLIEVKVTLIAALPLSDQESSLSRLVHFELIATLVILGLLAVVTFWVLRLGVRPLKTMTATATAIAAGDLSHRVPDVKPGTEAGELGNALNAMLGRLEEAFGQRDQTENRLRRFAADASHELRTPVTTIRGYAELYRRGALASPDDLSEAMRRTEQEAIRMGRLIEDLLLLARLDQGRPLDRRPVDLAAIGRDAVADAHATQPDRAISGRIPESLVVTGDEGRLRQVVANLMSNALVHTNPAVPIEVRVGSTEQIAVLEVHDDGPGLPPDDASQVFERFYRADPARTRVKGGAGLGLSISQAIAESHGGRVLFDSAPGRGTTVRVELPLDVAAQPQVDPMASSQPAQPAG